MLNLGGFKVEEKGITVIRLRVGNGGMDNGYSFKVNAWVECRRGDEDAPSRSARG